jgi:ketosteroid isomerase-like protein
VIAPGAQTGRLEVVAGGNFLTAETNKAIACGYLQAFADGNLAPLDDLIAPEYVRHDPGLPFDVRGPEGVKGLVSAIHAGFPDLRAAFDDVIAEGDRVLVRMTMRGTHLGEFMGMLPTGRKVNFGVMDLFRVAEGQIVEQ